MPHTKWSQQNDLLNSFHKAIQQGTQGRVTRLSVDCAEGVIAIRAYSESYYGIQLAIGVIKEFSAEFPEAAPSKMSFSINGHTIVLGGTPRKTVKESTTCGNIRQGHPSEHPRHAHGLRLYLASTHHTIYF